MHIKSLIKNRKVIISQLFFEFILFCSLFNFINSFQKLIFFGLFFLVSYVLGKYNLIFPSNLKLTLKFLSIYIYIYIFNFVVYYFFNNFVNYPINSIAFSFLYVKFLILTLTFQLLIFLIFFRNNNELRNWVAFIDTRVNNELDSYVQRYNRINIQKIKLINFKKLVKNDIKKIDGFIFEKKYLLESENIYRKISKRNKVFILSNTLDWCNDYLEFLPISLLIKFDARNYILPKDNFKIYDYFKIFGDLSISIFLIFLTLPLMLLVSIFIKMEDGGPIFYSQKRTGQNLQVFNIYKFRSMRVDAEDLGIQWSTRSDPRITKVGKFIRLTRLDELPQLISVIKGEMSLIGPRPERPEINEVLFKETDYFLDRYLVKPGLSGWAQVNYNYAASKEESIKKLGYDMYYLKNCSFLLDLLILFKTIKIVLNLEGALPK